MPFVTIEVQFRTGAYDDQRDRRRATEDLADELSRREDVYAVSVVDEPDLKAQAAEDPE